MASSENGMPCKRYDCIIRTLKQGKNGIDLTTFAGWELKEWRQRGRQSVPRDCPVRRLTDVVRILVLIKEKNFLFAFF